MSTADSCGMTVLTVALCGNHRKHQQSFDALRHAAHAHNAQLEAAHGRQTPTSSPGSPGATQADAPHAARGVYFRMVNLNFDAARQCFVLCADDSIRGEMPLQESVRREERTAGSPSRSKDGGASDSRPTSAHAASRARSGAVSAVPAHEIDILIHKVASFGSAAATRALQAFIHASQQGRVQWNRQQQRQQQQQQQLKAASGSADTAGDGREVGRSASTFPPAPTWPRPPLVVMDPLDKVSLLATRCTLCKLLDSEGRHGKQVAIIPRTFRWELPPLPPSTTSAASQAPSPLVTPVGVSSFVRLSPEEERQKSRANGGPEEKWWIAKPDEGTGPSFTHQLVLWKSADAQPHIPPAVHETLPKEASAFVVQEYYAYALPVVLKVYVIGAQVFIKASPTVKLLAMIESQLEEAVAAAKGSGADASGLNVPIRMDSQEKEMFTAAGLQTASAPCSHAVSPAATPEASEGNYQRVPAPPGPAAPNAAAPRQQRLSSAASAPPPLSSVQTSPSVSSEPASSVRAVVPDQYWQQFFAPGTPAHTHIVRLAQSLSATDGGLGLSLFGFDILLVPRRLAHEYQRVACPHGIGHAEGERGISVVTAAATGTALPSTGRKEEEEEPNGQPVPPADGSLFLFGPESMFDLESGAPTALLRDAIPVVIDVNYFPGYKGMASANANMLQLMTAFFLGDDNRRAGSGRRTVSASGAPGAGGSDAARARRRSSGNSANNSSGKKWYAKCATM